MFLNQLIGRLPKYCGDTHSLSIKCFVFFREDAGAVKNAIANAKEMTKETLETHTLLGVVFSPILKVANSEKVLHLCLTNIWQLKKNTGKM